VNAAYADLPASSEQILHPDAYIAGQAPIQVEGLDLWSALGASWNHTSDTTLGEAWMGVWLEGIGVPQAAAEMAAAGWGGDHLTVATRSDGGWALGWRIAWDAPIESTEFETAYAGVQAALPFETRLIHISDRETIVLQASSQAVLDTITSLAGG
jgi:hypothetical protein